jgi:hypothetical protein
VSASAGGSAADNSGQWWAGATGSIPSSASRVLPRVLVHGDFHGHNQLWDLAIPRWRAVVDFDIAGPRDPEFDFRYLPSQTPDSALFLAAVRHYQKRTARTLDLDRVMAWHLRTVLGDALWRSEAGVALPGGGDPSTWVDDLKRRLCKLEVRPALD